MGERAENGSLRVLFAGGGTGGHVMPGAATAEAIARLAPGSRCLFLSSARASEQSCRRALAAFETTPMPDTPFDGPAAAALFPWRAVRAAGHVLGVLRAFRPHVIVGLGSYNCFVPVLAGRALGIPTAAFESNAVPGRAVRLLAPLADRVLLQWSVPPRLLRARCALVVGTPVRRRIFTGHRLEARRRLGLSARGCTLLVMGGSQGALALNEALSGALRSLEPGATGLQVLHLTGPAHIAGAQRDRIGGRITYRPIGFLERMEDAYAAADFVLCRAGGSTLAELTALGLPAILVPYPHAADDHQSANAAVLAQASAALVIAQEELTPRRLADAVGSLAVDQPLRARLGRNARRLGRPRAALFAAAELARMAGLGDHVSDPCEARERGRNQISQRAA